MLFTDAIQWLRGFLFRKSLIRSLWLLDGKLMVVGGGGRQSSQKTFLIAFGLKRISRSTNFSTAPVCWSASQTSSCLLDFIYCSLRLQAPASQQGRLCLMCATQTLALIFFLSVVKCSARHCSVDDGMLLEVLQCFYSRCQGAQTPAGQSIGWKYLSSRWNRDALDWTQTHKCLKSQHGTSK